MIQLERWGEINKDLQGIAREEENLQFGVLEAKWGKDPKARERDELSNAANGSIKKEVQSSIQIRGSIWVYKVISWRKQGYWNFTRDSASAGTYILMLFSLCCLLSTH